MNRETFQLMLEEIAGSGRVYFQPPETLKIKYPAIVYAIDNYSNVFAGNHVYKQDKSYIVTVIDYDPDSIIVDKVSVLDKSNFNRYYVSDNLHHTVFKIYI